MTGREREGGREDSTREIITTFTCIEENSGSDRKSAKILWLL